MVSRKRLYYGFNGHYVPTVPRAPRSVRRRLPLKKPVEDHQICAFELLADVAGKLLEETESSASSNASHSKDFLGIHLDSRKQEQLEENDKASRLDFLDQGSCVESVFVPELPAEDLILQPTLQGLPVAKNDSFALQTSNFTWPNNSKKVDCGLKLGMCSTKIGAENFLRTKDSFSPSGEISNGRIENGKRQLEDEITESKDLAVANACHAKKPLDKYMKREPLINSDNSVQLPLYRNSFPSAAFPKHRKSVHLEIRDDDDNSFRHSRFNTKIRAFRPPPRNSYRRIRKMLISKYRKMAPRLKEYDLLNTNGGSRPFYRCRKLIHSRDSYHCENPSKRRKRCGRSFVVAYDREASSESVSNSPESGIKGEEFVSDTVLLRGNGVPTSGKVHKKPKDSKVQFSIKSFKVPELYIEVPETATVGSLKRTVMETVTAILGGGLRVEVVLQGKKVRDDNRTLQQAGISHSGSLDTLGFVLEPNLATSPKDSTYSFQRESELKFSRSPASPNMDSGLSKEAFGPASKTTLINQHDSDKEIMPSSVTPSDSSIDEAVADSKALVHVPGMNAEPLAALPMNPKTKQFEASYRRTRRPFSVGEVEALVEAVEIVGTGRWRDVKMRAFENADHRTYVDLKDKWKTLVHTASISPQQRRGVPVPQELLDRVLSAHGYWSQQHLSKQPGKHQVEPIKIMDAQDKAIDV